MGRCQRRPHPVRVGDRRRLSAGTAVDHIYQQQQQPDFTARSVTILASDGKALSNGVSPAINLTAVNNAPVITGPTSATAIEDEPVTFSSQGSNAFALTDIDGNGNIEQVTLNASMGTVTLGRTDQVTFIVGNGSGDQTVTFTGTLAELNAAVDGLVFTPLTHFHGSASIALQINDIGNTGSGGRGPQPGPHWSKCFP